MLAWRQLLHLPEAELARCDVAAANIACAEGLPGAERLDVPACLGALDQWAKQVHRETARYSSRFEARPAEFGHSKAYYRMLCLITVLHQDFGVRYNPNRIQDPDFADARDLFIHGILDGSGGTCSSMPVVYVAVGRRLGYPLKLVLAKAHVFARWDPQDRSHPLGEGRLNIEATGHGMNCPPDEYYRTWPQPIKDQEVARGYYLRSLAVREELALFLAQRGHCLQDNGRIAEAVEAYWWALALAPADPHYLAFWGVAAALNGERLPKGLEHLSEKARQERERIRAKQLTRTPPEDTRTAPHQ